MIHELIKKANLFKNDEIQKMELIKEGYTNQCFFIQLKNSKKYFLRIATYNIETPRNQEHYVLDLVKDSSVLFYDELNGNMIKVWIDGQTNFIWTNGLITKFVQKIKFLHNISYDPKKILLHNHFLDLSTFSSKIQKKYLYLIKKYQNMPVNFCHNDLNPGNIILDENNDLHFIDYEWSRINNKYWDLANFARETLNYEQMVFLINCYGQIDPVVFKDFLIITSYFALQWSFVQVENKKITSYIEKVEARMKVIFNFCF